MCVSAEVSFGMAGLLVAGGVFATRKAHETDARYIPLALFPVLVGIQQAMEGFVWTGAEGGAAYLHMAALGYLFFTWLVWPSYVPYMTAWLEPEMGKRKLLLFIAQAGLILGLILYLPNFWQAGWLNIEIINHSVAYQCTHITDSFVSHKWSYGLYLAIIGCSPLLSSYRALKIFGAGLITFVPLTYFFFYYAQVSVLCFFAALMTFYIIYVILEDKCSRKLTKNLAY